MSTLIRLLLMAVLILEPAHIASAQTVKLAEQDIKAALIYNFLKYTTWPGPPSDALVVCVLGQNSFAERLSPMAGRTVNQRIIGLRTINSVEDGRRCSLVFVGLDERPRWPALRTAVQGRAVLTVGEFDGFAKDGGMIEFARDDSRVAVLLNAQAVAASQLAVQDRLVRLTRAAGHPGARP